MQRKLKSENQKERDKKGKERMKRFEEGNSNQIVKNDDEDDIMVAYQKKGDGEWERVELPYKKKKK